jgi:hypothetical protein
MATRKYKGKLSKGSKNRTQKGGFLNSLKNFFGFSSQQKSEQSQNQFQQNQFQQNQQAGSNNIPEMSFGGKKKRRCRNK